MTDELPPLPEPAIRNAYGMANAFAYGYHADQMRAYARAAVLAERERCAKVCEAEAESLGSGGKRDAAALCCAAAIRAGTTN